MWWKIVLMGCVGLVIIFSIVIVLATKQWHANTKAMHAKLETGRRPSESKIYNPKELDGLPPPVQRYFRTVLKEGQPLVTAVRIRHTGTFNMSDTSEDWKPFTSNQRIIIQRPGFDWDARINMAPVLFVRVHDAYIGGEGLLCAKLCGLVPLVNMRSTSELAQGELLRFFAEMPWYPTALLPSQGVQWQAVDDCSAKATLHDREITATLMFCFDEDGLIQSVRADARGRTVSKQVIPTPWEGRWRNYESRDGMLIPLEGEVAWLVAEHLLPYWRGRIQYIQYEYAQ